MVWYQYGKVLSPYRYCGYRYHQFWNQARFVYTLHIMYLVLYRYQVPYQVTLATWWLYTVGSA